MSNTDKTVAVTVAPGHRLKTTDGYRIAGQTAQVDPSEVKELAARGVIVDPTAVKAAAPARKAAAAPVEGPSVKTTA